jgi:hypothetical protein
MSLEQEIENARKEISPDGYEMSVGEVMSLYRDGELIIDPAYQRLFRWNISQKTRFIESLLLSIPIPPIFVFQNEGGTWELIDGLQRLSTIFQFTGLLKTAPGDLPAGVEEKQPVALLGTTFLPHLADKTWDGPASSSIGKAAQLQIRRTRLRVEILKKESDPLAKYELFQRLNTGGTRLSEQEVRNCTAVMLDPTFHDWLISLSSYPVFKKSTSQTDQALKRQAGTELALRYLAFKYVPYMKGLDVHEYLDQALIELATWKGFDRRAAELDFKRTFDLLFGALGTNAFKRWDSKKFTGKFLMSVFEIMPAGVSKNYLRISALGSSGAKAFITKRAKDLWNSKTFVRNSGAGIRGTTRLENLLPEAGAFFKP